MSKYVLVKTNYSYTAADDRIIEIPSFSILKRKKFFKLQEEIERFFIVYPDGYLALGEGNYDEIQFYDSESIFSDFFMEVIPVTKDVAAYLVNAFGHDYNVANFNDLAANIDIAKLRAINQTLEELEESLDSQEFLDEEAQFDADFQDDDCGCPDDDEPVYFFFQPGY